MTGPGVPATRVRVVGPGRAGWSLVGALRSVGWEVPDPLPGDRAPGAAADTDLLVLAVPDAAVAEVAARVRPAGPAVVAHLAGALGLDVLAPHARRAALHPLASLPDRHSGPSRLRGIWWAVAAGDDPSRERAMAVVTALEGRPFGVPDDRRALYHAAACVAANHLVALLGQVERLAAAAGAPREALLGLSASVLPNVVGMGAAAALTGPAARGDWETVERHRRALPAGERTLYEALAAAAAALAGRTLPPPAGSAGG